jgi:hypothetical protein
VHPNPGFWRALQLEQARLQRLQAKTKNNHKEKSKINKKRNKKTKITSWRPQNCVRHPHLPPWKILFPAARSDILRFAHSRSTHKEKRKKKNGVHWERCLQT